jgi:creatinine amidohydrolase
MTSPRGIELATLTWQQAQAVLTPDTVAVIPLGAATKEHGPHLPLNTDWLQVQYLAQQVLAQAEVLLLPTISYSYYPAFVDYPGSVSLGVAAARDTVLGICQSLARHGVRRFYVINYGISTNGPLRAAAQTLAGQGALLHFTDLTQGGPVKQALQTAQGVGSHADLVETSVMLFVAPEVVNMALAVPDQHVEKSPGGLTRDPNGPGVYSPSGIYGNPVGATAEHGKALVQELLESLLRDIDNLRTAPLPLG